MIYSAVRRFAASPRVFKQVALVTGAGQGIGRAISLRLAKDGFDLALNDIPANESKVDALVGELKDVGSRAAKVLADVSQEQQVDKMVDGAMRELGGINVMVANAGIAVIQPLLQSTVKDWDKTFAINVRGVMLCYKYAAQAMIKQGSGGRLIGACSIAGKRGDPYSSAYSASKFAVRGLTQSAAQELAEHGITANCYAPGAIHTDLLEDIDKVFTQEDNESRGTWLQQRKLNTPLGRLGTPEDIARLVSFLASPDAEFITGQSITVDGGTLFD